MKIRFNMIKILPQIIGIVLVMFVSDWVYGQADTVKATAYEDLSLKDLLNVKIVSASKKSEPLFDAPLSASVVTKDEIRKAGCTSIMEALRLVPGMIVREESNGNYDIHIRGMDNIPPNTSFDVTSTTILVMIDNRPIYSYLRGGTFWETLPVDINDVERIEVIRGPAAALYGPNAVNGVINIITRLANKDGLYLVANSQKGSYHTSVNNASLGYKSKKWGIVASGNYQNRNRTQHSYYEFNRNALLDQPEYFITFSGDTATDVSKRYPYPALAMEKYAGNIFLNYSTTEKIKFYLSTGIQHSVAQKISAENEVTPLSTASSDSRYIDLRANLQDISIQASYNTGVQIVNYEPGDKYDFHTFDANVEYNYTRGNFSLKPGMSFKSAVYDDTKYSNTLLHEGIFNARGLITTQSAFFRGEYKLMNKKLRLVAGLSSSKFNHPDVRYLSYELAATYKVNKKQLFRMVYSRAPRSSNIFDTYVDQATSYFPSGIQNFTETALLGNKNLKLLTANMFEMGYRGSIGPWMDIDVELFDIRSKNYNSLVRSHPITEYNGTDTIHETPDIATNLPLEAVQQGITITLSSVTKKLQVKSFITVQHTMIKNYSPFNNTADAITPAAAQNNIYSGMGTKTISKSTPVVFGGLYINYILFPKININLNACYYGNQIYYHLSNVLFNDGVRGIDHISAKLIVNTSVSYEPVKGLHFFCSGKNLLNDKSREFFRTDNVPFTLLAGLNYEF